MLVLGAVLAVAALPQGCATDPAPVTVEVSWRFIDDRTCDLAGVSDVVISGIGPAPSHVRCADGQPPDGVVAVEVAGAPATVVAEGRSHTGALLYRGEAEIDRGQGEVCLNLRFVGGAGTSRR